VREVQEPTAGGGVREVQEIELREPVCREVRDRGETGIAVGVVVTEARLVVGTWIRAVRRMGMLHRVLLQCSTIRPPASIPDVPIP